MRGYVTRAGAPSGVRLAEDLPEPEPAPHELLLDVRAFAVNRGELFLVDQRPDGFRPGQDVAGVVARAAADGSGPPEGARVVGVVDWEGWAERVAVPAAWAASLPDEVGFEAAASLPIAGLTALRGLRLGGALLGRDVLVTGATGGVGQFAVQLGVAAGARVTAQVSRPEREEEARALGAADVVVDLAADGLGPFHHALDGVGGRVLQLAAELLAPGGTVVTYGTLGGRAELGLMDLAPNRRVHGLLFSEPPETKGEDIGILARLVAGGRLTPLLGLVRPWDDLPVVLDALRHRGVRGKAVLTREG